MPKCLFPLTDFNAVNTHPLFLDTECMASFFYSVPTAASISAASWRERKVRWRPACLALLSLAPGFLFFHSCTEPLILIWLRRNLMLLFNLTEIWDIVGVHWNKYLSMIEKKNIRIKEISFPLVLALLEVFWLHLRAGTGWISIASSSEPFSSYASIIYKPSLVHMTFWIINAFRKTWSFQDIM